uniref:Uncharacterized protein n=1 Tax=Erpetoichthys calabaricus TaxID=27687 RepID=A0A8C4RHZ8_ERPCA
MWHRLAVGFLLITQLPIVLTKSHYTHLGTPCITYSTYYWCKTRKRWDYCSPKQGLDIYGNKCKPDHPCGYHDGSTGYTWCNLEKGGWGKCGKVHERDVLFVSSTYNLVCQDECSTYGYDFFWCNTLKGWDYCSPLPDVTYKKEQCRSDHKCGLNGKSYNWCWTEKGWDMCGPIAEGECAHTVQNTQKRSLVAPELICTINDSGNRRLTRFEMQATSDLLDGSPYLNTATDLIAQWRNDLLTNQPRSNLITEDNLRIDLQNLPVSGGVRYYNL